VGAFYELQPMVPISVSVQEQDPGVGVVTLTGEHDAFSSTRLENELAVLIDDGLRLVVDLRDATFIDSQTLSVLLGARHHAEQASLGLALVLSEDRYTQVHRLLELTHLGTAFAVFPTVERAIAAVRAGEMGSDRAHVRDAPR
jgi:anti-anti-sigma factor